MSPALTQLERVTSMLRAAAHPTRIQILEALRDGEERQSPAQLSAAITPTVALGSVSHHVRELYSRGFLMKAGTTPVRGAVQHFYRISPRGQRALALVDQFIELDES